MTGIANFFYPLLALLLTVLSVHASAAASTCLSEKDIESFEPKLLGAAMSKGNWPCAQEIAEVAQVKKIDCRNEFDVNSRMIQQELSALKAAVDKTGAKKHISPAFRWAQSTNEVYVGVKFAHKLDAPMTSKKVEADNVTVTETMVYLHASDADGNKNFYLEIPLFGEVVPENSTWSMGSVGRMTLILGKKKAPTRWPRLMNHKNKVPNMHFWFEIDEQYSDALEELKTEKDIHSTPATPALENKSNETNVETDKNADKSKDAEPVEEKKPSAPMPPEAAALVAEKGTVLKELKARLAELDDEARKRKNAQDQQIRDAKAAIDKEYDALREAARQAAAEKTGAIDSKLGETLNAGQEKSEL